MHTYSDAGFTLAQTLDAIRFEEARGRMLIALAPGPGAPLNMQHFRDLEPPGARPPALELELIGPGDPAARTISQRLARGWTLAIYGPVFVSGRLEMVAAFRGAA